MVMRMHSNEDDTDDDKDSNELSIHGKGAKSVNHEMTHESRGAKYRFFVSPKGVWSVRHINIYVKNLY